MKKFLCFILFVNSYIYPHNNAEANMTVDQDMALLQEALEIVASMSDNIANLVIQHKTETNSPEMTKQEAIALVEKITSFVIVIIKKTKQKNVHRAIYLQNTKTIDILIEEIADKILKKTHEISTSVI